MRLGCSKKQDGGSKDKVGSYDYVLLLSFCFVVPCNKCSYETIFEPFYIVLAIKLVCFALFQRRTIDDLLLLSAVEEEEEEEEDSHVATLLLDLVAKEPRPFQRSFRIDFR